jgi:alpha-1,2-mannosyltransferase
MSLPDDSAGTPRGVKPKLIILVPAVLAALYGWAVFFTSFRHPGAIGPNYNTPGTDFMVFHAAVGVALRGDLALLFDVDRFTGYLNSTYHGVLSFPLAFRPFVYPPGFLVLMLPFAPLGFRAAWASFQLITGAAAFAALHGGADRKRAATAVAASVIVSPAASVNVLWGQTGFLTLALLAGGTRLMARRPVLAGLVFGVMSIKPQHALLVPVMLLALRAWKTMAAAAVGAVALSGVSWLLFGEGVWTGWLHLAVQNATGADPRWFLDGSRWDNSVHTCAWLLGLGNTGAAVLEVAALLGGAAAVYAAYRAPLAADVRLAVLLAATTLAAPHTGPYDTLLLVAAAGLLLADRGSAATMLTWTLGLCVWLLPLFGQPAISVPARFGPLLTVVLLAVLFRSRRPEAVAGPLPA